MATIDSLRDEDAEEVELLREMLARSVALEQDLAGIRVTLFGAEEVVRRARRHLELVKGSDDG